MVHWIWIVPLVLLIIFLASPRFRGDIAETRVRQILAAGLEKNRYTVLNDVTIPSGGGTVHIDHIVVSRLGLFVIESQYARGWISGGEFQQQWKQHHLYRRVLFDNPMHRNVLQLEALERLLQVPQSHLQPIVVMVGQKGFKTDMPGNLLEPEKLIGYIRKSARPKLQAEQADRLLTSIEDARIRPAGPGNFDRWKVLRLILVITLLAGAWLAFDDDIAELRRSLALQKEQESSPGRFNPDGSRKSAEQLWEASLVCAYSPDSDRCSCYEPGGSRAEISLEKCRTLAERGSVLKQ